MNIRDVKVTFGFSFLELILEVSKAIPNNFIIFRNSKIIFEKHFPKCEIDC